MLKKSLFIIQSNTRLNKAGVIFSAEYITTEYTQCDRFWYVDSRMKSFCSFFYLLWGCNVYSCLLCLSFFSTSPATEPSFLTPSDQSPTRKHILPVSSSTLPPAIRRETINIYLYVLCAGTVSISLFMYRHASSRKPFKFRFYTLCVVL